MRRLACVAAFVATMAVASSALAGPIPYGARGTVNGASYTFIAATSGDIVAYFVGQGAGFGSDIGMLVNGAPAQSFGLQNHTVNPGDSFNLGPVQAGDVLVFQLRVSNTYLGPTGPGDIRYNLFSDTSMNPVAGDQHIYSTAYVPQGTLDPIPAGTYVGFEDLTPASTMYSDLDYEDHEFVFTNVAVVSAPDGGSTLALFGAVMGGLAWIRRRRS